VIPLLSERSQVKNDLIINAISEGIRGDIQFNLDNERFRAVLILTYSAMDTMAFLGIPARQTEVGRKDFIGWASRYIRFPGADQLTGEDLYGARCGLLHTYGSDSKLSRAGQCRRLIYIHGPTTQPVIPYAGSMAVVMVSIPALVRALFDGIDTFLPQLFSDPDKKAIAEERLDKLMAYEKTSGDDMRFRGFRHGM
jgi:hypothetical protein